MRETELLPEDAAFPRGLLELARPPARLRLRGGLPDLRGAVAIVGTRFASDAALELSRSLGRAIAAAGRTVVSGGARGIDAEAHLGALEVGGPTACVLASGFSPPYPREHAGLFDAIAAQGALVSEQPDGPPQPGLFLRRNALIAALAEVTVVVQAPLRSGALSTAAWARGLGRPVFAVPHGPWDPRGAGCLHLLAQGARICTSAADILSVPAPRAPEATAPAPSQAEIPFDDEHLDRDGRIVLAALQVRALHADNLATRARLPIMKVQQALTQLLILGLAVERGPGRYAKKPDRTR